MVGDIVPGVGVLQFDGGGLFDVVVGVVPIVGTLLLFALLVAFAATVYRHLRGGIEWPDEADGSSESDVSEGDEDDEWKYY
ncbi:hypothetical protein SAMN04487947_3447 [Halogeometricum rufum]|uniref:Uncharacterized protein n=1 Tax=Halogeometricum rufum TaxID=553469 RepID=A0A1I6ILM9_9EURY|nr:hypothetical protein [Halogeometricum rufum]SFR67628.1 hypothetical protein SAMN04487947_3447 [Halogeometricum rufum]